MLVFIPRYGHLIYTWCRQRLPSHDAEDVTQEIFLKLLNALQKKEFVHDPHKRFRGYLYTLTRNACRDVLRNRRRSFRGIVGSVLRRLFHRKSAEEEILARMEDEVEREVFEEACGRVRFEVHPTHWKVFEMCALQGQRPAEVATALELDVTRVYRLHSDLKRRLRQEIQALQRREGLS